MYVESTRPSAKCEVQKERSAKRDDRIARPRRAQTCEQSELRAKRAMRMWPRSGQIFVIGAVSPFASVKCWADGGLCQLFKFTDLQPKFDPVLALYQANFHFYYAI